MSSFVRRAIRVSFCAYVVAILLSMQPLLAQTLDTNSQAAAPASAASEVSLPWAGVEARIQARRQRRQQQRGTNVSVSAAAQASATSTLPFAGFRSSTFLPPPEGYQNSALDDTQVLALADVNGDGKPDLINYYTSTVVTSAGTNAYQPYFQVLLNDGKGGYTEKLTKLTAQATSTLPPPNQCQAIDLAGSGKASLVCLQRTGSSSVASSMVLYAGNGDGTFAATPVTFSLANGYTLTGAVLRVGDFNGDGKQDAVVLEYAPYSTSTPTSRILTPTSYQIEAFLSNGSNGLAAAVTSYPACPKPNVTNASYVVTLSLTKAADVNGDKDDDLIMLCQEQSLSATFYTATVVSNVSKGDGSFTAAGGTTLYAASTPLSVTDIALLDADGSGHLGLAALYYQTASSTQSTDSYLQYSDGNGDGSFGTAGSSIDLPSDIVGEGLLTADLAQTGRKDLLVVANSEVGVLRNQGSSGGLAAPVLYPAFEAFEAFVGDWNGDGKADVLVAGNANTDNNAYDLLAGKGDGTLQSAAGLYPARNGIQTVNSMVSIDVNNDGYMDFAFSRFGVVYGSTGSTVYTNNVSVYTDDGKGNYSLNSGIITLPGSIASTSTHTAVSVVGAADFNGDGKTDLLLELLTTGSTITTQVGIALNQGNGTFAYPQTLVSGDASTRNNIFDVNGDGKPDVVLNTADGLVVYLNDGSGNLSKASTLSLSNDSPTDPVQIAAADFNGDSKLDLAVAYSGSVAWYAGNGDGTFGASSSVASLASVSNNIPIAAGDWNGDGAIDLAFAGSAASSSSNAANIFLYTNNGKGNFTEAGEISNLGFVSDDLADYGTVSGVIDTPIRLQAADFNGDGKLDLLLSAVFNAPGLNLYLGNGDSTFAAGQSIPVVYGYGSIWITNIHGAAKSLALPSAADGAGIVLMQNYAGLNASLSTSSSAVYANGAITLTATITPKVSDAPTVDGTVQFYEVSPTTGVYTSLGTAALSGTTAAYQPSGFTAGTHSYVAKYLGNSSYAVNSTNTVTVTVAAVPTVASTVTVTPSATSITDKQSLTVGVSVAGASGAAAPTGTVTLSSGSYSSQQALSSGAASFTIPAGTLATGSNTLTATYSGDATYQNSQSTATVAVSQISVAPPATPPAAVAPGATATTSATVSGGSQYSGTVNLKCTLSNSPAGAQSLPTCAVNPTTATLTPGSSTSIGITVSTTAASSANGALHAPAFGWMQGGGIALGALLLFIAPRRRRWMASFALLAAIFWGGATGCSSNSKSTTAVTTTATTSGTYTFTISASDASNSSLVSSANIKVTVQ